MLLLGACTPDPVVQVEYEPYEGDAFPRLVPPVDYPAHAALVTDSLGDTLSVIDLESGVRVDQRPVGRNPVDIDGPHHVALDVKAGFAYLPLSYPQVAAVGPHASHGSSAAPGYVQMLSLSDLRPLGSVRVDPNPGDIVLSADGSRILVSHFDLQRAIQNPTDLDKARARLAVIVPDQIGSGVQPTFLSTCVAPHGLVFLDDAGTRAAVACYGEDSLAIVDFAPTEPSIERFAVGPGVVGFGTPSYGPYAVLRSPDGLTLAVSNTESKDVRFFDLASKSFDLGRTVSTQGAPYFSAFTSDARLIIPTQQPDALVVVDLTGTLPDEVRNFSPQQCPFPHEVIAALGDFFVVCEGDKKAPGKVLKLDANLDPVAEIEVGIYPDALRLLTPGDL